MLLQLIVQVHYTLPCLHIRANLPPQIDDRITKACFKM